MRLLSVDSQFVSGYYIGLIRWLSGSRLLTNFIVPMSTRRSIAWFDSKKERIFVEADILIVDDEEGIRLSMQEFVTVSGFRTLTAESAEEALALLAERRVDVVITDIILPGMDGLELTDVIKKDYDIAFGHLYGIVSRSCRSSVFQKKVSDTKAILENINIVEFNMVHTPNSNNY